VSPNKKCFKGETGVLLWWASQKVLLYCLNCRPNLDIMDTILIY